MSMGWKPGATGLPPMGAQPAGMAVGTLYCGPGSTPLASITVPISRKVCHTVGTKAPLAAVAPIIELVSGCAIWPPEFGDSAGQSMAMNVCQPRFSQSFWVGTGVGLGLGGNTSTGTCQALGLTVALPCCGDAGFGAGADERLQEIFAATKAAAAMIIPTTMVLFFFMMRLSSFGFPHFWCRLVLRRRLGSLAALGADRPSQNRESLLRQQRHLQWFSFSQDHPPLS